MAQLFMFLAGLAGAAGVAFSAMAAHALQDTLAPKEIEWIETGGTYLLLHAPALALCALIGLRNSGRLVTAAGVLFSIGLICFSGGLLVLALTGFRPVIAIVPVGGSLLAIAWIVFGAIGLNWFRTNRKSQENPSESGANRSIDSTGQV
ncbi:MAG: DUF423 domain-containing protein [Alphaproteobacteria bacterium]|nr:DUF423 domain-containing protein [Alphaproteobacteria bacterium]